MNIEKYIASGILELYVSGSLSEKENQEVYDAILKYPAVKAEVEAIEQAFMNLSEAVGNRENNVPFSTIKNRINTEVVELDKITQRNKWIAYTGWAASVALLVGSLWLFTENQQLKEEIQISNTTNTNLEDQISKANESAEKMKALNAILRAENIESVALEGQSIAPNSFAKVFWNKKDQITYVDVAGLPAPPDGKVYQVWSLTLDPLSPTNLGVLEDFNADENKVFMLTNTNNSQAFGITLEPEGGSDTPTLAQLYALGVVKS